MKRIFTAKNILLQLIFILNITFTAKANFPTIKEKYVILNLVIEDTAMVHNSLIKITMNTNDINTLNGGNTKTYSKLFNGPQTRIKIPLSTFIDYGRIEYSNNLFNKKSLTLTNNLFLFQAGDTIDLHLSTKKFGIWFTGKNAEKFNCMYKISNSAVINSFSKANSDYSLKKFENYFDDFKIQLDSIFKVQIDILNEYKSRIDISIYNLIRLDCWGLCNKLIIDSYFNNSFMTKSKELYWAAKYVFMKDYGNYNERLSKDTSIMVKSYFYCDFLSTMERDYSIIVNSSTINNYYKELKFVDIDKTIDLHYKNGIIKDKLKLVVFYNVDKVNLPDYIEFVDKAINEAGNNKFKTALKAFKATNSIGANAFPFELIDVNGKIKRQNDFRGKLVIIDFWFTGCQGCTQMAESLKEIIPLYKINPQIVFLTISSDKNKEVWKKSLFDERYSSNDEINLLAIEGQQSPIIKHYNINSYPSLIVISKNGTIITTSPPDPRFDKRAFKDFIGKYLVN
jgi:cytochrome oxidase Cu insertion factor (SCO1/SenC/PrrC family)